MTAFTVIEGANFSGRSQLLGEILLGAKVSSTHFLGPHGESGLSGFASIVRDELVLYGRLEGLLTSPWRRFFERKLAQPVSSLSGGEQVMLGLTSIPTVQDRLHVGIDCAIEQLDRRNRQVAFELLQALSPESTVTLVDNRLVCPPWLAFRHLSANGAGTSFVLNVDDAIANSNWSLAATTIAFDDLHFAYDPARPVFADCNAKLSPGAVYRLAGENGSGKTTLLKMLCGVLEPRRGVIRLEQQVYAPTRHGNTLIAYATQNPDEQWTGTTLSTDFAVRAAHVVSTAALHHDDYDGPARLSHLAPAFGIDLGRERHLLDYPRALRKRLSWLWPLSGFMPWIALDEPTIGQDSNATTQLVRALIALCRRGYGVIVISHDDRLWASMKHRVLRIEQSKLFVDN